MARSGTSCPGSIRKAARFTVSNYRAPKNWNMIFSGARRAGVPNADGSAYSIVPIIEEVLVVRVHPEILRNEGLSEELRDEQTIW